MEYGVIGHIQTLEVLFYKGTKRECYDYAKRMFPQGCWIDPCGDEWFIGVGKLTNMNSLH